MEQFNNDQPEDKGHGFIIVIVATFLFVLYNIFKNKL